MLTHHAGEHRQQPTLQQVQTQEALRLSEDRFR
jgi:hypothetical protein